MVRQESSSAVPDPYGMALSAPVTYSAAVRSLMPSQIWLPAADVNRRLNFASQAQLTCVHINHFREGSRVSLASRPKRHHRLSDGGIAGTVLGVVAGCCLLAALAFFLWRRHQQRSPGVRRHSINGGFALEFEAKFPSELEIGPEKHELDPGRFRSEAPLNEKRHEMDAAGYPELAELHAESTQELDADDKITRELKHQLQVAKAQDMLS